MKIAQFDWHFEQILVRRRSIADAPGTGTDRRTLSVATGDYVAGRSAGYDNQAFSIITISVHTILRPGIYDPSPIRLVLRTFAPKNFPRTDFFKTLTTGRKL